MPRTARFGEINVVRRGPVNGDVIRRLVTGTVSEYPEAVPGPRVEGVYWIELDEPLRTTHCQPRTRPPVRVGRSGHFSASARTTKSLKRIVIRAASRWQPMPPPMPLECPHTQRHDSDTSESLSETFFVRRSQFLFENSYTCTLKHSKPSSFHVT